MPSAFAGYTFGPESRPTYTGKELERIDKIRNLVREVRWLDHYVHAPRKLAEKIFALESERGEKFEESTIRTLAVDHIRESEGMADCERMVAI
jgi:hypothetical protein